MTILLFIMTTALLVMIPQVVNYELDTSQWTILILITLMGYGGSALYYIAYKSINNQSVIGDETRKLYLDVLNEECEIYNGIRGAVGTDSSPMFIELDGIDGNILTFKNRKTGRIAFMMNLPNGEKIDDNLQDAHLCFYILGQNFIKQLHPDIWKEINN